MLRVSRVVLQLVQSVSAKGGAGERVHLHKEVDDVITGVKMSRLLTCIFSKISSSTAARVDSPTWPAPK